MLKTLIVLAAVAIVWTPTRCSPAESNASSDSPKVDRPSREGNSPSRKEALDLVTALGGHFDRKQPSPDDIVKSVYLWGTAISDTQLELLVALRGIEHLQLMNTGVTDAGMASIGRMTGLQSLHLQGTKITGKGLSQLRDLKNLRWLNVSETAVREQDLAALAGMKSLATVHPFGPDTVEAWLTTAELMSTAWAPSQDGLLSLRLLAPKNPIPAREPIVIFVELRNNSQQRDLTVIRPFGNGDIGPIGWIVLRNDTARQIRYSGPIADAFGRRSFPTLPPGNVMRNKSTLYTQFYSGSDRPGAYRVSAQYCVTEPDRRSAVEPDNGKPDLWTGKIVAGPLVVTKVAQPK